MASEECKLIGGLWEDFVQFLLFCTVVFVLWYKRKKERPQRPYKIWSLDVGKQICSGTEAHLLTLACAMWILPDDQGKDVDDCEWYFVIFSLDTTVGVALTYVFLKLTEKGARRWGWDSLKVSGDYGLGDNINYLAYFKQLVVWLLIILVVKSILVAENLL